MKKGFLIGAMMAFCFSSAAIASEGGNGAGNGGDTCELRIQNIRNDIKGWISKGGGKNLEFPEGVTPELYDSVMLAAIDNAKISCVNHPLKIGTVEKTCMNFPAPNESALIECNVNRFMNQTSESDQYVLIHHEYAGLAGLETNDGVESDYTISRQLTDYLEDQVVKKLAVKDPPRPTQGIFDPSVCQGPAFTTQDAKKYFPNGVNKVAIGSYGFYGRARICTHISGCGAWRPVSLASTNNGNGWSGYTPLSGQRISMALTATPNAPWFRADVLQRLGVATFAVGHEKLIPNSFQFLYYSQLIETTSATPFKGYEQLSNPKDGFVGGFRKNCGWFKVGVSAQGKHSNWQESEFVFYGTH